VEEKGKEYWVAKEQMFHLRGGSFASERNIHEKQKLWA